MQFIDIYIYMCRWITSLIMQAYKCKLQTSQYTSSSTELQILTMCPVQNAHISDITNVKKSNIVFKF